MNTLCRVALMYRLYLLVFEYLFNYLNHLNSKYYKLCMFIFHNFQTKSLKSYYLKIKNRRDNHFLFIHNIFDLPGSNCEISNGIEI